MTARKLLSILSTITIALGFIATTTSAQATDYSITTNAVATSDNPSGILPVGKTVAGDAIFLINKWVDDSQQMGYLKSVSVDSSGNVKPSNVIMPNTAGAMALPYSQNPTFIDQTGTIHLVFVKLDVTTPDFPIYKLFYTSSADGENWTPPVAIGGPNATVSPHCSPGCGAGLDYTIAGNNSGTLNVVYGTYYNDNGTLSNKVYSLTKALNKPWSTPTLIGSSAANGFNRLDIISTGKGWLAYWVNYEGDQKLYSTYATSDKGTSWTAPQARSDAQDCVSTPILGQTGSTKFTIAFNVSCVENTTNLISTTFESTTGRFGSRSTVKASTAGPLVESKFTKYVAGQSALVYNISNWQDHSNDIAQYIVYKNGRTSAAQDIDYAPGQNFRGYVLNSVHMRQNHELSIVFETRTTGASTVQLGQYLRGNKNLYPFALTDQGAWPNVLFSPDSDVYQLHYEIGQYKTMIRYRSEPPVIDGFVSVKGSAKSNATVSAKLPDISAESSEQKWVNRFQWYSCLFQVTESATEANQSCTAIPGATAPNYKAKAADKGKYLQVRLTVKSDNASQVQFSASTAVVK